MSLVQQRKWFARTSWLRQKQHCLRRVEFLCGNYAKNTLSFHDSTFGCIYKRLWAASDQDKDVSLVVFSGASSVPRDSRFGHLRTKSVSPASGIIIFGGDPTKLRVGKPHRLRATARFRIVQHYVDHAGAGQTRYFLCATHPGAPQNLAPTTTEPTTSAPVCAYHLDHHRTYHHSACRHDYHRTSGQQRCATTVEPTTSAPTTTTTVEPTTSAPGAYHHDAAGETTVNTAAYHHDHHGDVSAYHHDHEPTTSA